MPSRQGGKVAIVTGSGSGIGRAIAKRLASEGASVVINSLKASDVEVVARELVDAGGAALPIVADVSRWDEVVEMVDSTLRAFGQIDILVNNAGIIRIGPLWEMQEADWDQVLNVNLKAAYLCCKAVIPNLIKQGSGKIVNISSDAGKTGYALVAAYSASKFGLLGLTQSLAREVAKYRINVNAVCPGTTANTGMRRYVDGELQKLGANILPDLPPLGRLVLPEDVANVAAFLCSSDAEFITGQAINVTGGSATY